MVAGTEVGNWSPSVNRALEWASGCAALRGEPRVGSLELFVGLLLAHADPKGEVWQLLDYFGLTARDLLPDDYPVLDGATLIEAAAASRGVDPAGWDDEVASIMSDAASRAGGTSHVIHVMAELLARPAWEARLQPALTRFGINAGELVRELSEAVPEIHEARNPRAAAIQSVDPGSFTTAGERIGRWLADRFQRRPATLASFSNDVPDPSADFIGVNEEADAFAYLIASRTLVPPLAIGLFGDWGSGKSFLMAKIRHRVGQLTSLAATEPEPDSSEIWTKVVPIEFNAWQYVETDLWAALLSRIFDELSPQARKQLTELSRRQQELRAEEDLNLREQLRAEEAVSVLLEEEESQAHEAELAADVLERVNQQVAALQDAAVRAALGAHARSATTTVLIGGAGSALGPQVSAAVGVLTEAVDEARRLRVAADSPAWRQSKFWSPSRVVWVTLAVLVVPALVIILDLAEVSPPTAVTVALSAGVAAFIPILRAAADFAEAQRKAALDAAAKVEQEMAGLVNQAEKDLADRRGEVEATRARIREEKDNAAKAAARGLDLARMGARLTAGTAYADFLSGRYSSDEYRKRLGIVSTVSDDLETLSSLVAEYNATSDAQRIPGPPNRIVLYIDDLDRCPPKRVVEVLEAVHLLLAFPLFVVVVAVDTRWLTAALSSALTILQEKTDPEASAPTAMDYVEKIFQIPFCVEPLGDGERHRLMRGLLLPSVARSSDGAGGDGHQDPLKVTKSERDAAQKMLAVHGPWLDRDPQSFTITAAELKFLEALSPLVAGTPRQVKRFVNICKLLLAMSPPLTGDGGPVTERTAACFMAALHQSMPEFSEKLAAAAEASSPGASVQNVLSGMVDVEPDRRDRVQNWLATQSRDLPPGAVAFAAGDASMLLKRWEVIRRLRFAG